MNRSNYTYLYTTNSFRDKKLFLKFHNFEGKSEEILFFNIWVCNLILYVGNCLDINNVVVT